MSDNYNILIILHTEYERSNFDEGIEHKSNNIYYFGENKYLQTIPKRLKHNKIFSPSKEILEKHIINEIGKLNITFDFIIANSELTLMPAAKVRQELNISGSKPDQVEKVTNKVVMKNFIKKSGINIPKYLSLEYALKNKVYAEKLFKRDKIVLKPINGSGSEGVYFYENFGFLYQEISKLNINIIDYEVEEYIPGEIYHLDALVCDKSVIEYIPSKYINTCADFANGEPLGSFQIAKKKQYLELLKKTINALDIEIGAVHLEIIKSTKDDEYYFLEVANRTGGAEIRTLFSEKTGINFSASECSLQINKTIIYNSRKKRNSYFGFFQIPGHHLNFEYCKIVGLEKWLKHPNLLKMTCLDERKKISKTITYRPDKLPVSMTLKASSPSTLEKLIKDIFQDKEIQILPTMNETNYVK
ncbi:ATP-grasp domain-containing protein [Pigmentibacter sp. JX0631]|uniref:ATP-grasp domain-containing protein n=1 Tax=Pigmentibacter sp. JX0631 TaxID=2976982 RepID=UPI002468CAFF|nr:ATP-grasp domain-containing protein [Pigmentibacter sp. JX0631]WGL60474.1 ATP-grasp domain-containing protein [Pigmentibacter sp. JX0631]